MNSITTDHTLRDVPVYFPDGMARLSRHGWLVLHRDGSHALRWLPVHIPKGRGTTSLITTNALPLSQTTRPEYSAH